MSISRGNGFTRSGKFVDTDMPNNALNSDVRKRRFALLFARRLTQTLGRGEEMLRTTGDCQADADRFIRRVTEADVVWYLNSEQGPAVSESNIEPDDGNEEPPTILLFFSDEAYAKRAQAKSFPLHQTASMTLFDFMYRWLPGMSRDRVLAGPNWTGELIGLEVDPLELRESIEGVMSEEHLVRHKQSYRKLTGTQNEA